MACENQKTTKENAAKKEYVAVTITPETITSITLNDSMKRVIKTRGREISKITGKALKSELQAAIKTGGPEHAVSFCYTRAMEITDSVSLAQQVKVQRLAKKNRNPLNQLDENQDNLYKGYVITYMNKERPYATVGWNEEGSPIYYYPITVDAVCLNCHGTPGQEVNPKVAEKIAELYPNDNAMGFKVGDPRGMWAITFPEYKVVKVE
jgi:hypothetical protein